MKRNRRSDDSWTVILIILLLAGAAAADDPQPQSEPSPAETPFGRILKQLFDGFTPPPATPNTTQQQPANQSEQPLIDQTPRIEQDSIDDKARVAREQQRELMLAERLLAAGRQSESLTVLQQLLDEPEDTLTLNDEGHWKSFHSTVEQVIGDGGSDLHAAYVKRFGTQAENELRQAKQSGDARRLALVTRRFLHTPAGREAAIILAARFRDLGDPIESQWWQQRANGEEPGHPRNDQTPRDVPPTARPIVSEEWRQPFGGPRHQGIATAADPVLIERWSQPTTVRPAVAEQVERLTQDLIDSGRACLPATIPLAVDGKLITRTLRGVSVFDADSGRLLWESAEGISIERLLTGEEAPRPGGEPIAKDVRMIPPYRGTNPDAQVLTGLLYRDGVYGLLSSDGEQVFVIEDHATLAYRQPGYFSSQRRREDPFGRDWASNQLTAYDLDTGSVRWRIGGESLQEPFDPLLAGTLFLGPPVVDRDELFLIGERNKSLMLFCLDSLTGRLLWSHGLSEAGTEIEQDLVRRWWPAQPAVGTGVIVCPTTQGWLVAVDRLEHRIRWAYRYIEARQKKVRSNRSQLATVGLLNSRWSPAAPILTDRYVVFTPPELPDPLHGEQPIVVCVDVLTGERHWRKPKETRLALGGVSSGRVVLVGKESLEAWDIATEKRLWETPFDLQKADVAQQVTANSKTPFGVAGPPSGRGLIAGDEYLMPLQSGQLWFIDLATGQVRRTMALREEQQPLGNLTVYRGNLFSVGPLSVRSFEERTEITSMLAEANSPPATASARLRAAELCVIEGNFAAARLTLQALSIEELSDIEQRQQSDLLWDALVHLVRGDLSGSDVAFAELDAEASTDQQRLTVERLQADRLLARGQLSAAFDVYWEHALAPRQVMVDEQDATLRFDRWLAGRLQTLWEAASPDDRGAFDQRIADTVEIVIHEENPSLSWWAEVLRFHPHGIRLRRRLAEQSLAQERLAAGEIQLLQILEQKPEPELRAWVLERMVQLLLDQGRSDDAADWLERLEVDVASLQGLDESSRNQLLETSAPVPIWSEGTWRLQRTPAAYNRSMYEPMLALAPALPSLSRMKLRVEPNLHRLVIETHSGEHLWETPLRSQPQTFYSNHTTGIASLGQLLFVVHRGVLHAVSLPDQSQLWRQPFDVQSASGGYVRGPSLARQQELRTVNQFLWSDGLRQTKTPLGMLAVWRAGYIAYLGQHTLTVADPLTGTTFWTRRGIRPRTMVFGTNDMLFVVPPSPEKPYALRMLDGSEVDLPQLGSLVRSAVGVTEQGLVILQEQQPLKLFGWGTRATTLRLVDPFDGQELWALDFPDATRFAHLSEEEILAVTPDGDIRLIDCTHGTQRSLGLVGKETLEETQRWFAIPEGDRVYLAFNQHPKPGAYSRSYQSAPVNGTLAAFDRHSGLLWTESIEDQNLVLDQLAQLPVLVFNAQRPERNGDVSSQQVFVELRDKQTGRELLKESRYIIGGNVREMTVDQARQLIDLKTYRDRLRLSMTNE